MAGGKRGGQGGRGAKPGSSRKGAQIGSGGQRRKGLQGKGPTPPAEQRPGHPAARRASSAARRSTASGAAGGTAPRGSGARGSAAAGSGAAPRAGTGRRREPRGDATEMVVGRNPVVEALVARVPATALYVATGIDSDDRVTEAIKLAGRFGVPLLEAGRGELDRRSGGAYHQGVLLQVAPYTYLHPDDLLARSLEDVHAPLLVALDGVTDPRNLGAVVRSAAAFGAQGVLVPERRAAGMTAGAWKASAGAAARLPVARATNLVRALGSFADAGLLVAGLAADGDVSLDQLEAAVDPIVLVVGSEGRGMSRLVGERCDLTVSIPMAGGNESLNASVAAGIALYEIDRRRRAAGHTARL